MLNRLLLCFLLFLPAFSQAADNQLSARHYGILQGLPDQAALDIVQDEDQQIWISTSNGLARFNGESFEVFRHQPGNDNSLMGNSISAIEMIDQKMWLLIEEMGLSRYLPKEKQFKHEVSGKDSDPSQLLNSDIFAITSDKNGRLFVFQFNGGISVKEVGSDRFTHHTRENSPWLTSLMFFDAEVSEGNQLWAVTLDGKALHWDLNNNSQKWYQVVDDSRAGANGLYDVSFDSEGQVWVSGFAGVYRHEEGAGGFSAAVSEDQITAYFGKHVSVRSSFFDGSGKLWLATLDGLLRYENQQLHAVSLMTASQKQVNKMYVNKLFEDHENNLWVLTMEQGVFVVGNQWQHQNIIPISHEGESIKAAAVYSKSEQDVLYLSHEFSPKIETIESGTNKRDYSYLIWQTYGPEIHLKPNVVLAEKQGLWIGGISGLYWQEEGQEIASIALQSEGSSKEFTINKMLMGKKDDLWVHAYGLNQLWQIDRRSVAKQSILELKGADLVDMKWLSDHEMLLVHDHQLWLYDMATGQWRSLFETPQFINNISLSGDRLWLVVNGVLQLMQWQAGELNRLPFEWPEDLNYFVIKQLTQDDLGRLWLVSENGLVIFEPENKNWRLLDTDTGLPSPRVIAVHHKSDGSHWVVSSKGVVHIFDELFIAASTPVNLNIESIRLNNSEVNNSGTFTLKHQYGLIQFQYALASYNQPNSHRFEYRLTDQAPWQSVGDSHLLSLHDLTPGNYQLAIRGKSELHAWSEPKVVHFDVEPPWWYSKIALVSYGLLLILFAVVMRTLLRKRWLYRQTLAEALSRQQFAETQLDLTSSLVGALETEALLAKIKKVISDQIAVNDVLVAFWNEEGPWSAFSEKVPLQQQLSLKMFAQQMQQNNEKHSFHDHANNYFLTVWFNHSDKRFGFIQLRNDSPFSRNDLVKAKACATQSSLALENARLYTEVNLLAEKAQAASQAKSDFLAQVSHEVRTPMNGILGMNQLLMASELSQDQRQYTEAVAESGSHLLHIINDILDFSKIEAGQLSLEHRPFDLLDLLDDILGMFSATAKQKGLLFYLDIDPDLTSARIGDALRLKQLMMNLLSNAFKFTQTGKVILSVSYASGGVVVSVTDTGTGVSAEQQSALFEPFTQADSSITRTHGGTGLGLSIVKQLCELMGGHVAIESELGKGSCFSCHLALDVDSCADESLTTNSPVVGVIAGDSKLTAALIAQCEVIGCHSKALNTGEPLTGLSFVFYLVTEPLSEQCVESLREYATKADETSLQMVVIKTEAVDLSTEVADGLVLNFPLKSAQLKQLLGLGTSIEVSEKPSTFNQVASKGKDVLVLEDNLINQELMRHLLEKVGHRIHVFDHAKDALAALNGGLTCDLMLVDYHLPDVSGIEFINQARLLMPAVPCAILTADVSDELSVLCEGHQIEHVFTKPLNLDDLYQLIVD